MKKNYILIFVALLLFSSVSCKNDKKTKPKDWEKIDNQLVKVNKYLLEEDQERIESYIKRKKWQMTQTETGLWYEIYEKGSGDSIKTNDIVTINYRVELLDGTLCYTSDSLGSRSFKVGRAEIESGIHEGVKLMNVGSKARFILPPHLAHGLLGDENKIPSRAIIVYDLELLSVEAEK